MRQTLAFLYRYYRKLISNIAFIPTMMSVFSLILAVVIMWFESHNYTAWWVDNAPFLLVKGADNARMILTTIIGGVLSLTVFSFSMVMVVLNRATASLSPRVLPQLIAKKSHQVVLGFYMSTIIYSLVLIINVDGSSDIPSLAILLSMIFTIGCLGLFIYFINSISLSIQVDRILEDVYAITLKNIQFATEKTISPEFITAYDNFRRQRKKYEVKAPSDGYYRIMDITKFLKNHADVSAFLEVCIDEEQYTPEGAVLYHFHTDPENIESLKSLLDYFDITKVSNHEDSPYFGLRKISEIAVKALSPGINDPGTAFRAIRHLSLLFRELLKVPKIKAITREGCDIKVAIPQPGIDCLLESNISSIRLYAGQATDIYRALIDFFKALLNSNKGIKQKALEDHYKALKITIENNVNNKIDLRNLKKYMKT